LAFHEKIPQQQHIDFFNLFI